MKYIKWLIRLPILVICLPVAVLAQVIKELSDRKDYWELWKP